jgi:DNA-binding NtrC family response regulator
MPLSLQVKILRALQDRVVLKVGDTEPRARGHPRGRRHQPRPRDEIRTGGFREDLYYRLNVVHLHLPPLRDRGDDIVVLARYMLSRYAPEYGNKVRGFTPSAIAAVKRHRWPGNIRELENRIKKAVVLADKALLGPEDLGLNPDELPPILPLAEAREQVAARVHQRGAWPSTGATAPRPPATWASTRAPSSATWRRRKVEAMNRRRPRAAEALIAPCPRALRSDSTRSRRAC